MKENPTVDRPSGHSAQAAHTETLSDLLDQLLICRHATTGLRWSPIDCLTCSLII